MSRAKTKGKPKGRPVTVRGTEFVGARLSADLVGKIDTHAEQEGIGRSEAVRRLIEAGLKQLPKPRKT